MRVITISYISYLQYVLCRYICTENLIDHENKNLLERPLEPSLRIHADFERQSAVMSSPSLGQSVESLGSPRYTPTASQYPFPSYDPAQRPSSSARHGARRDSTTAPITSIDGVVDSSTQSRNIPIAEAGNNGKLAPLACRTACTAHTLSA